MKNLLTGIFLVLLLIFSGCGDDDSSDSGDVSDGDAINDSVVSMPSSLKGSSSSSRADSDNSGGIAGLYEGIPHYVALADNMGTVVKDMLVGIVNEGFLDSLEKGTKIETGNTDPEEASALMVEDDSTYDYKLSLYFSKETPDMIIRFTVADGKAKGHMLFNTDETDEKITTLIIPTKLDLTFDGTGDTKTIEIKFIQDISSVIEYAKNNPGDTSIDIGRPTKVFLNATFDESTGKYTVYGTSFHAGWSTLQTLNREDKLPWDISTRSIYIFKAAATETHAKVFLSFPENTKTTVENIWVDDSVAKNVVPAFSEKFRLMINSTETNSATLDAFKNIFTSTWGITTLTASDFTTVDGVHYLTADGFEKFNTWVMNLSETEAASKDLSSYRRLFLSLQALVSPALFVKDSSSGKSRLLGTYDEDKENFFEYAEGMLKKPTSLTTDGESAQSLVTPDDSLLYVPNDVYTADITIE